MIWIILAFGANFISRWIRIRIGMRIRIQETNLMRIHADPDPKHWPASPTNSLFLLPLHATTMTQVLDFVVGLARAKKILVANLLHHKRKSKWANRPTTCAIRTPRRPRELWALSPLILKKTAVWPAGICQFPWGLKWTMNKVLSDNLGLVKKLAHWVLKLLS